MNANDANLNGWLHLARQVLVGEFSGADEATMQLQNPDGSPQVVIVQAPFNPEDIIGPPAAAKG